MARASSGDCVIQGIAVGLQGVVIILSLNIGKLFLSVLFDELIDDNVATADTDDQSAVQLLGINLLRPEQIIAVREFLDRHGAAILIEGLTEKVVQGIASGNILDFDRCWRNLFFLFI